MARPGDTRLHLKAASQLNRLMDRYHPFGQPPEMVWTRNYLRDFAAALKPASRPGRKPMPHYQVAIRDFKQIKVPKRLAVAMLRGCGIMVPGPPPKG